MGPGNKSRVTSEFVETALTVPKQTISARMAAVPPANLSGPLCSVGFCSSDTDRPCRRHSCERVKPRRPRSRPGRVTRQSSNSKLVDIYPLETAERQIAFELSEISRLRHRNQFIPNAFALNKQQQSGLLCSKGYIVFHEDNGFRDMFIYGSMAMLAALALPSKKAHAAEFYLCGDGRTVELTNSSRLVAMEQDACVKSWYEERMKVASSKSGKAPGAVRAGVSVSAKAERSSAGYQIQTSAIEPLINAIEVPEDKAIIHKPASHREMARKERSVQSARARKIAEVSRPSRGLRHMGDGIYAQ